MRVLFITNRFPGQLMRGDQLRAFQQIRQLSQRHEITLLSFGAAEGDAQSRSIVHACCKRVIVAKRSAVGMAWRGACALFTQQPLQVAVYDSVPASTKLNTLLSEGKFDLAHLQLARLGPMLRRLAPLPCVIDLVDALSLNMARRAVLDRGPMRWVAAIEARRLIAYERHLCAVAKSAAVSSTPDRDAIGAPNLHLVRNGFDLQRFPFAPAPRPGSDIVFVGNLGYFPNIDAAQWFAQEVMPQLATRMPDARFKMVGARPDANLLRIAQQAANVDLIGEVADVYPYLSQAAVAVVPLRAGSGQQLKLIEAMAAGTPVVATSLSAAGLDAIDGEHLLIGDDAQSMSDAIVRLLSEPQLTQRLALAARALVERAHSWESSAHDMERLWIDALHSPL
jgi:polysaccharide biosynthesis protein PslH